MLLAYRATEGGSRDFAAAVRENSVGNAPIPFVVGEGNSASCGGMPGVSDTMTSALWALDFLPGVSKAGGQAMNFHGGPEGPYAAIAFNSSAPGVPTVRPLFYGLLAFSELVGNHSRWIAASIEGPATPPKTDPACLTGIPGGGGNDSTIQACCAASCGQCGGTGCKNLPGGSDGCCTGTILRANVSCTTHEPPCVADKTWTPAVAAHATVDRDGTTKVLVVAKDLRAATALAIEVCIPGLAAGARGTVARLVAAAGASATSGVQWAGLTWDGTSDGNPSGTREAEPVGKKTGSDGVVCFEFSLSPLTAALLFVT